MAHRTRRRNLTTALLAAFAALVAVSALALALTARVVLSLVSVATAEGAIVAPAQLVPPPAEEARQGTAAARPADAPADDVAREEDGPAEPRPDAWKRLGAPELAAARERATRGDLARRMLHFTFDDGPHPERTPRLLDDLDELGVRATFFVVGASLSGPQSLERRALLQRMEASGHTVANHTFRHEDLRSTRRDRVAADLARAETVLEGTLGYRPGLFRPPFGGRSAASDAVLHGRGYAQVLWTFAPEYGASSSAQIVRNFARALDRSSRDSRVRGGVVLLHDLQSASVDAFPALVEEVRRRNCELLGVAGEELWVITDDLRPFLLGEAGLAPAEAAQLQVRARREATQRCAVPDEAVE
jgi:peptidoglycan/xylan/chitin deacetylase (PgdA/CDA1 family)